MRCAYCHNPDTWRMDIGNTMEISELLDRYHRNSSYYQHGGITLSGGEPLAQPEFVLELLKQTHAQGIHVAIDTCGTLYSDDQKAIMDQIIDLADLFLLDIKHPLPTPYQQLTTRPLQPTIDMANAINTHGKAMWIRYVVVPGINDDDASIDALAKLIAPWSMVKKVEFLPYHTMGIPKYKALGIPYRLQGVQPPSKQAVMTIKQTFLRALRHYRGLIKNT